MIIKFNRIVFFILIVLVKNVYCQQDTQDPKQWKILKDSIIKEKDNLNKFMLANRGIQYVLGAKNVGFEQRLNYFYYFLSVYLQSTKLHYFSKDKLNLANFTSLPDNIKLMIEQLTQQIGSEQNPKMTEAYKLIIQNLAPINDKIPCLKLANDSRNLVNSITNDLNPYITILQNLSNIKD